MGIENVPLLAFNRGLISPLGLARIDLKRTAMSSKHQTNWMPRVLGSQMLRPGWEYTGGLYNNLTAVHIPFIYSSTDKAILEFTNNSMRVKLDDTAITYPSVSTAVTNGDMSAAGSWNDQDETGATSGFTGGFMTLVGTGFNSAIREQTLTIAGGDQNVEHCLKIVIELGPGSVVFGIGSTTGGDEYLSKTSLGTGEHYITFTPTGANAYIHFASSNKYTSKVDSCDIFTGELGIATRWSESDLKSIRWEQSADVIYIACKNLHHAKIERRSTRSWSVVDYDTIDGPFRIQNLTSVRITPSALSGDVTLTATSGIFKSTNIDSLYRLPSIGQKVEASITAEDQWSDYIQVIGTDSTRNITVDLTGTWVATVTLQRSVGEPGDWVDVTTYTANTSTTYNDSLDNQIIYYRIGVATGDFTSGTVEASLTYASGSITGIVYVTGYTSPTVVTGIVVKELGGTDAVLDWSEGEWSPRRGYPTANAIYEGRLWWAGKSKIWGSISDAYEGFDPDYEGDAAPISRSIGSGPVDNINFLIPLQRLILGTDGAEWPARSTSFDEPLTKSNFNLKSPSSQGSANVPALKIDDRGIFVQRSGTKIYQITYGDGGYAVDYSSTNLCEIVPEIGKAGIVRVAVQRQPDTRIHCVLGDGRVAILVSEPAEEVKCWLNVETDGMVEDVFVLPGLEEDEVYYAVRRLINGSVVRYLEKWAMESECRGGTVNKQADSFVTYDSTATDTLTGLSHLEGENVVVWGDGVYQGEYIVASGQITIDNTIRQGIVGKDYDAEYLSSKLAYAAMQGTALTKHKRIDHVGLVLADTHAKGIKYGSSLSAKINKFLYSDAFDNAKWTKTATTISADSILDPEGTTTADTLVEDGTTAEHLVSQVVTLRQKDHNTFSVYAKPAGRDYIRLKMTGDSGTVSAIFDLANGTIVTSSLDNTSNGEGIRAKITEEDNGFYRCSITGICDTDGTFGVTGTISLSTDGSTISYTGDSASGAYIWRAQIEPGKKLSDSIITTVRKVKEYLRLESMPEVEDHKTVDPDEIWSEYDEQGIIFPGTWSTDSRIAFVASAPKPCTMLAAVVDIKTDG